MKESSIVLPGYKLSTEEEFLPSEYIFAENGNLYAALVGKPSVDNGHISIQSDNSIKKYKKGMFVSGVVVGDLKSIIFIKIDNLILGGNKYVAIKDGKVPIPKPRDFRGGMRDRKEPERPCAMGDVILARIYMEDDDSYMLSFRDPNSGVIISKCDRCGETMKSSNKGGIICSVCEFRARKKISPLYGKSKEVEEVIKKSIDENANYTEDDRQPSRRHSRYGKNSN